MSVSHAVSGGDYGSNNVAADSVAVTVAARGVIVDPQTLDVVAGAPHVFGRVGDPPDCFGDGDAGEWGHGHGDGVGRVDVHGVGLGGRADCDGQRRRRRVGDGHPQRAGGDYARTPMSPWRADSVTVTVAARGVIVDPQTLDVVAGATSTYSVVLATRPTASVTVTPASGDTATATVSGALTFTVSDWAVAQTVTVSGAAAGSATVTHSVAGGDYGANNVAADSVTVTVAARGVIVDPQTLDVVAGATSTYTIVLATRPTASVTVTPASGDTSRRRL